MSQNYNQTCNKIQIQIVIRIHWIRPSNLLTLNIIMSLISSICTKLFHLSCDIHPLKLLQNKYTFTFTFLDITSRDIATHPLELYIIFHTALQAPSYYHATSAHPLKYKQYQTHMMATLHRMHHHSPSSPHLLHKLHIHHTPFLLTHVPFT